ncbi:MAG TPA: zf-HC2 domain-containing protein [Bryobacteraceae bacterium]|nr:zf-HC2 domain-containing protein [Bryobacteraceae bacterium]
MKCSSVKRRVSAYLDDAVSAEEGRLLARHLSTCRECTLETEHYARIREKLRTLPRRPPPPDLTTRLRVVASKVRAEAGASPWRRWLDRRELSLHDLMRPLALPAAGGLCSAIFLFSTFVPMFKSAYTLSSLTGDVPTILTTQPSLKDIAPVALSGGDAVVDLQIDDQGRIVNFTIVSAPGQQSEVIRRRIENSLLFTEFWPATTFGRPVAGTIRISFRDSSIDVRG